MKLLKDGTDPSDKTEYFRCDRCRSVWASRPQEFRVAFAPFSRVRYGVSECPVCGGTSVIYRIP